MKASEVMSKSLTTAKPEETLQKVHNLMDNHKIHHILIVDSDGKLVGIVSDRDIKKFISPFVSSDRATTQDKATLQIPVSKIMKTDLQTVGPEDQVKVVVEKMLQKKIHAIAVVDPQSELPKGIVTSTDMLRLLVSKL